MLLQADPLGLRPCPFKRCSFISDGSCNPLVTRAAKIGAGTGNRLHNIQEAKPFWQRDVKGDTGERLRTPAVSPKKPGREEMDKSTQATLSLLAVVVPNHPCHEAWTDPDNKVTALPENGASQTCPSPKSHQTGQPHRRRSPCTCFKHHLWVSKAVKPATCSPNCIASSLSQCHPSRESVQTPETPPRQSWASRKPRRASPRQTRHAVEPASPPAGAPAAPEGRVWLRQAGSGTRERQGTHPVSLHGLAGVCVAARLGPYGLEPPHLPMGDV